VSKSQGDGDHPQEQAWPEEAKQLQGSLNAIRRQQEEHERKAAADPRYQQDPPTFLKAVRQWALRDRWSIAEAANLLCRCEPKRPTGLPGHGRLDRQVQDMRQALHRSALAREGKRDAALMDAAAGINWARGKSLNLHEELAEQFPGDSGPISSDQRPKIVHGNARRYAAQRETVLRAAVAVLARYRHQCLDANGQPTGAAIARLIEVHQATLFDTGVAPQSADQMARHICEALKLWKDEG